MKRILAEFLSAITASRRAIKAWGLPDYLPASHMLSPPPEKPAKDERLIEGPQAEKICDLFDLRQSDSDQKKFPLCAKVCLRDGYPSITAIGMRGYKIFTALGTDINLITVDHDKNTYDLLTSHNGIVKQARWEICGDGSYIKTSSAKPRLESQDFKMAISRMHRAFTLAQQPAGPTS